MLRSRLSKKLKDEARYPIAFDSDEELDLDDLPSSSVKAEGAKEEDGESSVGDEDILEDGDFVVDTNPEVIDVEPAADAPNTPKTPKKASRRRRRKDMNPLKSFGAGLESLSESYIDKTRKLYEKSAAEALSRHCLMKPEMAVATNDPIPCAELSDLKLRKLRKAEREKSKGPKWYNLPAPEMTDERKRDLEVLRNLHLLDPKRFYKKQDLKNVLPKYFQFGKVMDNPLDFYSSRIPKKQRKRTIVEELLADADFTSYRKRKMEEIRERIRRKPTKAEKHAKRLKTRGRKGRR